MALSALLAAAVAARAGAFGVREQSATAQGESFAGVAAGAGGLSSMFWNPATITMTPGIQSEAHGSVIIPYANIEPDFATRDEIARLGSTIIPVPPTGPLAGRLGSFGPFGSAPFDSGNIGQTTLVPSSYSSYQINDRLWVGLSVNGPFGLVTKADPFWAGQVYGRSSRIFTLNATPTVGVKLTDWLSIGTGVQVPIYRCGPVAGGAGPGRLERVPTKRAACARGHPGTDQSAQRLHRRPDGRIASGTERADYGRRHWRRLYA